MLTYTGSTQYRSSLQSFINGGWLRGGDCGGALSLGTQEQATKGIWVRGACCLQLYKH